MRVYEIAKDLGISSKEILSMLKEKGIDLPSHMSILSDQAIDLIKKKFTKATANANASEKKSSEKPAGKSTSQKPVEPKKTEIKNTAIKNEDSLSQVSKKPTTTDAFKHAKPVYQQAQSQSQPQTQTRPQQYQSQPQRSSGSSTHTSSSSFSSSPSSSSHQSAQAAMNKSFRESEEQEVQGEIQGQEKFSKILISKGLLPKAPVKKPFGRRRRRVFKVKPVFVERPPVTEVTITKSLPLFEAADLFGKPTGELIIALLKKGMACNRNNILAVDVLQQLGEQFAIKVIVQLEKQRQETTVTKPTVMTGTTRAPIVVVMGHVDHGKTTFLDFIRKMNVAGGEKGGITQHLGAYEVDGSHGKTVFLDTPGHEAFSYIRERGSKITDIAVLMVAVDDGIKPQTIEAINQAKAAQVPIIVAVNKIDKMQSPAALETIKRQLAQYELMPEDWGGQTIVVPISAKTGAGVDKLLDMITLQAEMMDLKADAKAPAKAFILESRLEKGFGPVATIICTQGTIKQGDYFTCGAATGKVRLLRNSKGQKLSEAGPSIPVQVIGFDSFASIGDWLTVVPMQTYLQTKSDRPTISQKAATPPDFTQSLATATGAHKKADKSINLILKTDTRGSKEAVMDSIEKLVKANKEIKCPINIIQSGIGDISEGDVELAANTGATIMTLHVKVEKNAQHLAKQKDVNVQSFDIIYHMIDYLDGVLKSKKEVVISWKKVGEATVKKVFDIKGTGVIAGCYMRDGVLARNNKVACVRNGKTIAESKVTSLQRDKKPVKEVHAGFEFGFTADKFNDWIEGDTVFSYEEVKEKA